MNGQWKIYLCSEDARIRTRWGSALETGSQTADFDRGEKLRRRCEGDSSELILLHLELPDLGGESGVKEFCGTFPDSRVLVLADHPEDRLGIAVLKAGARGFANTYIDPRLLSKAIAALQSGEVWVGRRLMARLIEAMAGRSAQAGGSAANPIGR